MGKGIPRGLFLILNILNVADASKAFVPIPYKVSVGKTITFPAWMSLAASSIIADSGEMGLIFTTMDKLSTGNHKASI
jgi:hypothetical protein